MGREVGGGVGVGGTGGAKEHAVQSRGGGCVPVIFRGRHLGCPLQNLKQDIGCCVPPPHKMAEVVKVLWPNKLQQLDLHSMERQGEEWQHHYDRAECLLHQVASMPRTDRIGTPNSGAQIVWLEGMERSRFEAGSTGSVTVSSVYCGKCLRGAQGQPVMQPAFHALLPLQESTSNNL